MWSHFDGSKCPGAAVGVKCRLDSGVTGFIHTKNISDKMVRDPQERVKVCLVASLYYVGRASWACVWFFCVFF